MLIHKKVTSSHVQIATQSSENIGNLILLFWKFPIQ